MPLGVFATTIRSLLYRSVFARFRQAASVGDEGMEWVNPENALVDDTSYAYAEGPAYLYNEGEGEDDWIPGFSNGDGTASKEADHLLLAPEGSTVQKWFVTDAEIDLTGIDTLYVEWSATLTPSGSAATARFGVSPVQADNNTNPGITRSTSTTGRVVDQVDVSSVSGNYYVKVGARNSFALNSATVEVYRVWYMTTIGQTHPLTLTNAPGLYVPGAAPITKTEVRLRKYASPPAEPAEILDSVAAGVQTVNTPLATALLQATLPLGPPTAGDILFYVSQSWGTNSTAWSPSSGFELVGEEILPGQNNPRIFAYARPAVIADEESAVVDLGTASTDNNSDTADVRAMGHLYRIRGNPDDIFNAVGIEGGTSGGSSTNVTAPGVTTDRNNCLLIGMWTHLIFDTTFTAPAGMTEHYDTTFASLGVNTGTNNDGTLMSASKALPTSGATGDQTAVGGLSDIFSRGVLYAFNPPPYGDVEDADVRLVVDGERVGENKALEGEWNEIVPAHQLLVQDQEVDGLWVLDGDTADVPDSTIHGNDGTREYAEDQLEQEPLYDHGLPSMRFATNSITATSSLTFSGDLVTDEERAEGEEGDGLPLGSGVNISPARENICGNGGFETNTTGWGVAGITTIARSTEQAKFGDASLRITTAADQFLTHYVNVTVAASTTYTLSGWVYLPSDWDGGDIQVRTGSMSSSPAVTVLNEVRASGLITEQWQRVSMTFTTSSDTSIHLPFGTIGTPSSGRTVFLDGVQFELGSVATPYIETDGGTESKTAGRIQATVADLGITANNGAVFAMVRTNYASASDPVTDPGYFTWADDNNNGYRIFYSNTSDVLRIRRANGGVVAEANVSNTFSANAHISLYAGWSPTALGVGVNGGNISITASTNVPTLSATSADVGQDYVFTPNRYSFQTFRWMVWFNATLSNTDNAALHALGAAAPTWQQVYNALSITGRDALRAYWDGVGEEIVTFDGSSPYVNIGSPEHLDDLFATNPPPTGELIFTGGLVTDAVRTDTGAGAVTGLGTGIWPAGQNLWRAPVGVDTTMITTGGTNVLEVVTFADEDIPNLVTPDGFEITTGFKVTYKNSETLLQNTTTTINNADHALRCYAYIPEAVDGRQVAAFFNGFTSATSSSLTNYGTIGAWGAAQRIMTPDVGDLTGEFLVSLTGPPPVDSVFYITAIQVEQAGLQTPLISGSLANATWSGTPHQSTSSRSAGRIQFPVEGLFNETDGAVFVMTNLPYATAYTGNNFGRLFTWESDDSTQEIRAIRVSGGAPLNVLRETTSGNSTSVSGTFNANTNVAWLGGWNKARIFASFNGGSAGGGTLNNFIPDLSAVTHMDLGRATSAASNYLGGTYRWVATFTAMITQADTVALRDLGPTPTPYQVYRALSRDGRDKISAFWDAKDDAFYTREDILSVGATVGGVFRWNGGGTSPRLFDKQTGWQAWLEATPQRMYFAHAFDGTGGAWRTTTALVPGHDYAWRIKYSNLSADHSPIFWLYDLTADQEIVDAATLTVPAVGAAGSDAAADMYIGNRADNARSFDGLLSIPHVKRGITSQAQDEAFKDALLYALRQTVTYEWDEEELETLGVTGADVNAGDFGIALSANVNDGEARVEYGEWKVEW